ncbi:MAG: hypothetical protein O7J95_08805 [Planctomycetota bacterium]|nr:hypothetical protein [Planctomycetota bacterium]
MNTICRCVRRLPAGVLLLLVGLSVTLALPGPVLRGQAFDCMMLRNGNTDLFGEEPDECKPPDQVWCNCASSAFSNPVKGEVSGFRQAIMQFEDARGIGNFRVEVDAGTLDLSGVQVDDVIGGITLREIGASVLGVPVGSTLELDGEMKVTALGDNSVDFDVNITFLNLLFVIAVTFDPRDEAHSFGHLYSGRLTSHGPGNGFTVEMRFAVENVLKDDVTGEILQHAGVEITDHCDPGFSTRFLFRWFTTETGVYTLPADRDAVGLTTTMRRFDEGFDDPPCLGQDDLLPYSLDEIFDLGTPDLLEVLPMVRRTCDGKMVPGDANPGKVIEEMAVLRDPGQANQPPKPVITAINGEVGFLLSGDPTLLLTPACFAANSITGIFSAVNSGDGDGGYQIPDFGYEWFIAGGPNGATIPDTHVELREAEILFDAEGVYQIGLRITDNGAANNTAEAILELEVGFEPVNVPPTAVISTLPDPPELELVEGMATIELDGSASSPGPEFEADACAQVVVHTWSQLEGPADATIVSPFEPITTVEFDTPGVYTFELLADDLALDNNTATATVVVTVGPLGTRFVRGDGNADGEINLTDGILTLNFLFGGGGEPLCVDAADADDDGGALPTLTDAIIIFQWLFLGGPAPRAPSPSAASYQPEDCGIDPTDDLMDCAMSPAACSQ